MVQSDALRDIASGTLGGLAQIASGHPFDTVKVNLQERGSETRFHGAVDCVRKLVAAEGLGGLYKGAAAPVAARSGAFPPSTSSTRGASCAGSLGP